MRQSVTFFRWNRKQEASVYHITMNFLNFCLMNRNSVKETGICSDCFENTTTLAMFNTRIFDFFNSDDKMEKSASYGGKGGKGSGVWPSMVTHTRNLSSAFNPSKCTLTAVNTHLEQWAAIFRRPGSSWGIGALLKGLTSVVVLKVERALVIHSPHRQSLPDLGIEPATFVLQVQLSNH